MTEQPDDQRLWDALVAAEWEHAHRRAEFYQQARSRTDVITAALAGSSADQSTALRFLAVLPDDVPAVLDRLIELSLSHRWSLEARQAIAPAWRAGRLPDLPRKVLARLQDADDDEYRRLAELLLHLQATAELHELVKRAEQSTDPDIREVADDFAAH
ncbi:hypothetical protein [Paractinoplanes durhamensis]|uniref:HEAT repeat domain-containing protein n=1 Tax=Paractinoplanes durhamensis TaxID=113563 RepID=A0ABQ3YYZ8_9ACTN|nr:hypothetical protein [Actinoplanes durhamensis]GIE02797.1 hypothetical protein Adu01nite_41470 [Actinoplanes durhamensis]